MATAWVTAGGVLTVNNSAVRALSASVAVTAQGGFLLGLLVANLDDTNPVQIDVYDGTDANGEYLLTVALGPNATFHEGPSVPGWPLSSGIFLDVIEGMADVTTTYGRY